MKVKITMLTEFKDFTLWGNGIDMAVGIIIGAAFGKIVSPRITDVIMPLLVFFWTA